MPGYLEMSQPRLEEFSELRFLMTLNLLRKVASVSCERDSDENVKPALTCLSLNTKYSPNHAEFGPMLDNVSYVNLRI